MTDNPYRRRYPLYDPFPYGGYETGSSMFDPRYQTGGPLAPPPPYTGTPVPEWKRTAPQYQMGAGTSAPQYMGGGGVDTTSTTGPWYYDAETNSYYNASGMRISEAQYQSIQQAGYLGGQGIAYTGHFSGVGAIPWARSYSTGKSKFLSDLGGYNEAEDPGAQERAQARLQNMSRNKQMQVRAAIAMQRVTADNFNPFAWRNQQPGGGGTGVNTPSYGGPPVVWRP